MSSHDELTELRSRLEKEISALSAELQRKQQALSALETVESLLSPSSGQIIIPGTESYEELGPSQIVMRIVESRDKEWSMSEILQAAEEGGKDISKYTKPYNAFYVAAQRLAKQGRIRIVKRGTKNYFCRAEPKIGVEPL